MALAIGLSVSRMSLRTLRVRRKAIVPPSTGEISQLATMLPIFSHSTDSIPMPTVPKPTSAPTMVCVVDTGQPKWLATINQVPAASSAASMPRTRISGDGTTEASMIPLRMVLVTWPPARKAPENSKIAAMMIALRTVMAPDPTEVPMALATSLAPTPQVM